MHFSAASPVRGCLPFWSLFLHPSAILLAWLLAVVATPWLDYPGIALLAAVLLCLPGNLAGWFRQLRRARWLLLTLWLVFAMGVPGEPFADIAWAPTYEGIAEANRHVLRLGLMLGFLAALFACLGRQGLVAGLWGLMPASEACERLVVRLALVLENAYRPEMQGAWKKMLHGAASPLGGERLELKTVAWRWRDGVLLAVCGFVLVGAVIW